MNFTENKEQKSFTYTILDLKAMDYKDRIVFLKSLELDKKDEPSEVTVDMRIRSFSLKEKIDA